MTYQKPYTFRAGTYAKAAEVNANFDTVKDFVDELQDAIGNVEVSKTPYNKANLQGNSDVIFYCADAPQGQGKAAINLDQLTDAITDVNNAISSNIESITTNTEAISDLQTQITEISLAPSYTNYTSIPAESGAFEYGGLLYLTNGDTTAHNVTLGTFSFIIRANSNVTFPVKQGTEYNLSNFTGNVSRILFTF